MTRLFDDGLQPERTELSWRRTCLALAVGSLVAMRVVPVAFGNPWWVVAGTAGLVTSGVFWLAARRRYRSVTDILRVAGDRGRVSVGGLAFALAVLVAIIGICGIAVVVALALSSE